MRFKCIFMRHQIYALAQSRIERTQVYWFDGAAQAHDGLCTAFYVGT